jgi:hypothetical protein
MRGDKHPSHFSPRTIGWAQIAILSSRKPSDAPLDEASLGIKQQNRQRQIIGRVSRSLTSTFVIRTLCKRYFWVTLNGFLALPYLLTMSQTALNQEASQP